MDPQGGLGRPPSLQELLQRLEGSRGTRKWIDTGAEIAYSSASPADFLAVATRCIVRKTDPPSGEVWITDQSLPREKHLSVVVVLCGTLAAKAIQEQKLSPGSLVRFNGLSLKRKIILRNGDKNQHKITYELYHDYEYPRVGAQWFVLGQISSKNNQLTRIPVEMETDLIQIHKLIQWYKQSNVEMALLTSMPCQKRHLEDVVSSVGVVSNVTVKISNLETISETPIHSKKKRRVSPSSDGRRILLVATVSDGHGTQVPFICERKKFQGKLYQAYQADQAITLKAVVCRRGQSAVPGCLEEQDWNDRVVLVPTEQTSMVLVSRAKKALLWDTSNAKMAQQTQLPTLSDTQPHQSQPQPFFTPAQTQTTSRQHQSSQFFTATQPTSSPATNEAKQTDSTAIEASLRSICFPNEKQILKHGEPALAVPRKLASILIDGMNYRSAALVLDAKDKNVHLNADPDALRGLCGDIPADKLARNPKYQGMVASLLQGLLGDRNTLVFKLQPSKADGCDYELVKVTSY